MLTQGRASDPKYKLNISPFITLPYLLDCLISTKNSVTIALGELIRSVNFLLLMTLGRRSRSLPHILRRF